MQEYLKIRKTAKEKIAEARSLLKTAFDEESQKLLKTLNIQSFSWTQYTPYFNDGDACVFSVNADEPEINGTNSYEQWYYDYSIKDYVSEVENPISREYWADVSEFIYGFDADDLLYMFGDHVRVTVDSTGTSTQEWDHD